MSQSKIIEIFQKLQQGVNQHPELAKELGGSYLFHITGEEEGWFYLHFKDEPYVAFEERSADCTVTARDRDFLKVYNGSIPGYKAVLSGKLKIQGSLELAARLGEVFAAFREKKKGDQSGEAPRP